MNKILIFLLTISNFIPVAQGFKDSLTKRVITGYKKEGTVTSRVAKISTPIFDAPHKTDPSTQFTDGKANYSIDLDSNTILADFNSDQRLEIASLTKLMTAYLVLKDLPLDKVIEVPNYNLQTGDAVMGINPSEKITVSNLLKGLLLNSGSDAAQTLAIADAGSVDRFVDKMNSTANQLKLVNTHYANPVGWDDPNNYSSAKEVATLARVLLRNQAFANIVKERADSVTTVDGRTINLVSTNELLGDSNMAGVKTGFTNSAGQCLVALKIDGDKKILTVILGSVDRFGQTRELFNWINSNFLW